MIQPDLISVAFFDDSLDFLEERMFDKKTSDAELLEYAPKGTYKMFIREWNVLHSDQKDTILQLVPGAIPRIVYTKNILSERR